MYLTNQIELIKNTSAWEKNWLEVHYYYYYWKFIAKYMHSECLKYIICKALWEWLLTSVLFCSDFGFVDLWLMDLSSGLWVLLFFCFFFFFIIPKVLQFNFLLLLKSHWLLQKNVLLHNNGSHSSAFLKYVWRRRKEYLYSARMH